MKVNRESIITIQKELSNLIGCPGREEEVTDYLLLKLEQLDVDKAWVDPLGNVLAIKEGSDPNGLRILLDAHVDEVGFIITHISDDGFIYITPLGGVDKRLMLGSLLQFQNEEKERIIFADTRNFHYNQRLFEEKGLIQIDPLIVLPPYGPSNFSFFVLNGIAHPPSSCLILSNHFSDFSILSS